MTPFGIVTVAAVGVFMLWTTVAIVTHVRQTKRVHLHILSFLMTQRNGATAFELKRSLRKARDLRMPLQHFKRFVDRLDNLELISGTMRNREMIYTITHKGREYYERTFA